MVGPEVISEIVEMIWLNVLGKNIEPAPASAPDPVRAADPDGAGLVGRIQFTGNWMGELTASCSEALARRIATIMFMQDADVSESDLRDAFGEVVNMLGGNLKALLPPPCHLSLPTVTFEADSTHPNATADIVSTTHFVSEGEFLMVSVTRANHAEHERG
jgi:chemotaxis protein CheX